MIASSQPEEREAIGRIAQGVAVFDADEIATVYELFDDYLRDAQATGYYFLSYRSNGQTLGFACYGPTPLTEGTYDLYWICTAREAHQNGVGRALMQRVEEEVRAAGGRLIVISTSSSPAYQAAREFYRRVGCTLDGVVPDYYHSGDDLLLFTRRVAQES